LQIAKPAVAVANAAAAKLRSQDRLKIINRQEYHQTKTAGFTFKSGVFSGTGHFSKQTNTRPTGPEEKPT
jgi:hypothetical protein